MSCFYALAAVPLSEGYLHVVMITVQLLQRDTMPKAAHESKHLTGDFLTGLEG